MDVGTHGTNNIKIFPSFMTMMSILTLTNTFTPSWLLTTGNLSSWISNDTLWWCGFDDLILPHSQVTVNGTNWKWYWPLATDINIPRSQFQGHWFLKNSTLTSLQIYTNIAIECCFANGVPNLMKPNCTPRHNVTKCNPLLINSFNSTWESIFCHDTNLTCSEMITLLNLRPIVRTEQVQTLPLAYINVAQQCQKHILQFNIAFPTTPPCRVRRA